MNYEKIYNDLIKIAQSRIPPNEYSERHHIVPKSMGGTNSKSNIAILTAREHYLAHWLLYRIYKNKETASAWYRMTHGRKAVKRYTSWTFCYARKAHSENLSKLFTGKKFSQEHKEKLSRAKLGKTYTQMGRGVSPLRWHKYGEDFKKKISAARSGVTHSCEAKEKIKISKIGCLNPNYGKETPENVRKKISESMKRFRHEQRQSAG